MLFFSLWVDVKLRLGTSNLSLTFKLTDFLIDRTADVVREIFISFPLCKPYLDRVSTLTLRLYGTPVGRCGFYLPFPPHVY